MAAGRMAVCILRLGYFPQDPRVRKEVSALLEEGHTVDVVCLRDHGEEPEGSWNGAAVHRLPVRHRRLGAINYLREYASFTLRALVKIASLHRRRRFDIVQVNTMPDVLVFAALVPRLLGARIVLDLHELMPEMFQASDLPLKRLLVSALRWTERLAVRLSHLVLVANPRQVPVIGGRTSGRFVLIPNVPDEAVFSGRPAAIPPERPVLATQATIVERYGVHVLVEAMPAIIREVDAEAWVIGEGEFLPTVRSLAADLGVSEHVVFTGRIPLEEMPDRLCRATIGVVPLLRDGYMETITPNKLFEFVALGRPVLAADLPGLRAFFDDDQVQFFRPGDPGDLARQALAMLRDEGRRTAMARRALETYESVRWSRTKKTYTDALRGLVPGATLGRRGPTRADQAVMG